MNNLPIGEYIHKKRKEDPARLVLVLGNRHMNLIIVDVATMTAQFILSALATSDWPFLLVLILIETFTRKRMQNKFNDLYRKKENVNRRAITATF